MKQVEIEHEIETPDGSFVLFDVTVNINSFGSPGYTSGPPEKCYPPEGPEMEIDSIRLKPIGVYHGVDGIELSPKLWVMLGFTVAVQRGLEEKALEIASEEARDYEADRADYEYERRRDDKEIRDSE